MISKKSLGYTIKHELLEECASFLEASGALTLIEGYYEESRGQGGRTAERRFSMLGVLALQAALITIGRVPSDSETWRMIRELSDSQLRRLGMTPAARSATYGSFARWVTSRRAPLDPGFDLPACRVTNSEHRRHLASRSPETAAACALAAERLHTVVNLIVAASIDEKDPPGGQGDVVVDETIIDLAGQSDGLGSKDNKFRAAAYAGAYYLRDRVDNGIVTDGGSVRSVKKTGFGIGVTAVTRVGPTADLYAIPPVITAIAIHQPTSASISGMRRALEAHQSNGLDQRRGGRARMPYLTVDMGYNQKRDFSDACLELGYSPVVRYPRSWRLLWASAGSEHTLDGQAAGPVQIAGDFYCPVAAEFSGRDKLVRKTVDMLSDDDGFDQHDRRLERLLPLLMGTNSRPYRARKRGRPRQGDQANDLGVRIDLVCPAVQGRVRCPLKPASMLNEHGMAPTVSPSWSAERYRCCAKSQVTVPYSEDQWRMATWGLTPGSWEHATYFEAARSLTEQRFSLMKSQHTNGFSDLKWSARREPAINLLIALWVARTNRWIQNKSASGTKLESSIRVRMRQIAEDIGRAPVKIPPRT
ncbi:hypothetical protein [Corynebacterium sp. A21]|uniref:hypothetical protein n=1 Tax=Corynebacterium sp. A21 TaxID=3457318 RepID=UPI003FD574E1